VKGLASYSPETVPTTGFEKLFDQENKMHPKELRNG
jgi:hypothetical protein